MQRSASQISVSLGHQAVDWVPPHEPTQLFFRQCCDRNGVRLEGNAMPYWDIIETRVLREPTQLARYAGSIFQGQPDPCCHGNLHILAATSLRAGLLAFPLMQSYGSESHNGRKASKVIVGQQYRAGTCLDPP